MPLLRDGLNPKIWMDMYSTPNLITAAGPIAETRPNRTAVFIRTQRSADSVCASAGVFLQTLLLLNRHLFRHSVYEWEGYAANTTRIQNASFAMVCALPLLIFAMPHRFNPNLREVEKGNRIALAAAVRTPLLRPVFDHNHWAGAMGIARQSKRLHQPFCIISNWSVMLGAGAIWREASGATRLILSRKQKNCSLPCLVADSNYAAELPPMPVFSVPPTIPGYPAAICLNGRQLEAIASSHRAVEELQIPDSAAPVEKDLRHYLQSLQSLRLSPR